MDICKSPTPRLLKKERESMHLLDTYFYLHVLLLSKGRQPPFLSIIKNIFALYCIAVLYCTVFAGSSPPISTNVNCPPGHSRTPDCAAAGYNGRSQRDRLQSRGHREVRAFVRQKMEHTTPVFAGLSRRTCV